MPIEQSSHIGIWNRVLINKSDRPVLLEDEHNLCVRDNVGLYQGKSKIVNRQNGRIYLTNKRVIYLDNTDKDLSCAVDLNDVLSGVPIDGFLRSSPKVKIFIKQLARNADDNGGAAGGGGGETKPNKQQKESRFDWVCNICYFNNHATTRMNLDEELPKCSSCGIQPSKKLLTRAMNKAVAKDSPRSTNASSRSGTPAPAAIDFSSPSPPPAPSPAPAHTSSDAQCPKCTFINHPSMKYCEMCGTELRSSLPKELQQRLQISHQQPATLIPKTEANPLNIILEYNVEMYTDGNPYIKLSFRKGGEAQFSELLNEAINTIKWDRLVDRGMVNEDATKVVSEHEQQSQNIQRKKQQIRSAGINSLEKLGEQQRQQNEVILSTSLEDLEQLMYKAHDLLKLSSSFSRLIKPSDPTVSKFVGKKMIPPIEINQRLKANTQLYQEELARHLSEYLINYELLKPTSMITSQELFADYNRYLIITRGYGTDFIDAEVFNKCLEKFEVLNLPVRVTTYSRSGLVVLAQRYRRGEQELVQIIVQFLQQKQEQFKYEKLKNEWYVANVNEDNGDTDDYLHEKYSVFQGDTIASISDHFHWSYGITIEEIEKCVELGYVVIDQHISGTFYFVNQFDQPDTSHDDEQLLQRVKQDLMNEQRQISDQLKQQYESENRLISLNPQFEFGSDTSGLPERQAEQDDQERSEQKRVEHDEQDEQNDTGQVEAGQHADSALMTPSESSLSQLTGLKF